METNRPQKIKVFATASSAALEHEMNNWLRSTSPVPLVTDMQVCGWGEAGAAGSYTVLAILIYQ